MCADNVVRALFPVGGQVEIGQVVTGQTLASHDSSAVKTVRGNSGSLPMWTSLGPRPVAALTEFVVSEFYVGQMQAPIVLSLVDERVSRPPTVSEPTTRRRGEAEAEPEADTEADTEPDTP